MIAGNWTTSNSTFLVETDADGNSNNVLQVPTAVPPVKDTGSPRVELVNAEQFPVASTTPGKQLTSAKGPASNDDNEQRGSAPTVLRLQLPGTLAPARALNFLKGLLVLGAAAAALIEAKRKF